MMKRSVINRTSFGLSLSVLVFLMLFFISSTGIAFGALVGVSWEGDFFRIDNNTGFGTFVADTGFEHLNSMAIDASGKIYSSTDYYLGTHHLITIDPLTGLGTAGPAVSLDVRSMAFSPQGTLYAIHGPTGSNSILYTINKVTGASTLVGDTGVGGIQGLEFSPTGVLYGYAVGYGSGIGAGLITIDPMSGIAHDVNPNVSGNADDIQTLAFGSDGKLYGAREKLFTLNVSTGVQSLVGGIGNYDIRGIGCIVPEPSTLIMLGMGAFSLQAYVWRRRKYRP
jgi:hypothetical protein